LGPLLFSTCISDLVDFRGDDAKLFLFAGDAKYFAHINNTIDFSTLQCKIDKFTDWRDKQLVKLNVSKCKIVSLS